MASDLASKMEAFSINKEAMERDYVVRRYPRCCEARAVAPSAARCVHVANRAFFPSVLRSLNRVLSTVPLRRKL
jgi:hypothetical protein